MRWQCDLPAPMSLNNAYSNIPGRGRVLTKRGRAWKDEATAMIMAAGPRHRFQGEVLVQLIFCPSMSSPRIDTDNCAKLILDVLVTMGILPDDNRTTVVDLLLSWRGYDLPTGSRAIVRD